MSAQVKYMFNTDPLCMTLHNMPRQRKKHKIFHILSDALLILHRLRKLRQDGGYLDVAPSSYTLTVK